MTPTAFRHSVRNNAYQKPTAGICPGFAQANLIVLPKKMRMISYYWRNGIQNLYRS